jgi:molybdopterin synthase sulfur carrier subunit
VRLVYQAWIADAIGLRSEVVEIPAHVTTVAALVDWLSRRGPGYGRAFEFAEIMSVIVNRRCVPYDAPVGDTDEVMFIPPIAGG